MSRKSSSRSGTSAFLPAMAASRSITSWSPASPLRHGAKLYSDPGNEREGAPHHRIAGRAQGPWRPRCPIDPGERPGPRDPRQVRGALHVHGPFSDDARGQRRSDAPGTHAQAGPRLRGHHGPRRTTARLPDIVDGVLVWPASRGRPTVATRWCWARARSASVSTESPRPSCATPPRQGGFVLPPIPRSAPRGEPLDRGVRRPRRAWRSLNFAEPGSWPRGARTPAHAVALSVRPARRAACAAFRPGRESLGAVGRLPRGNGRPRAGWAATPTEASPSARCSSRCRRTGRSSGLGSNHLTLAAARTGDVDHDGALVWSALRHGPRIRRPRRYGRRVAVPLRGGRRLAARGARRDPGAGRRCQGADRGRGGGPAGDRPRADA